MFSNRMEAQRDAAAVPVKRLIRRDRALVPEELKPLLAYIEEHLFDESFSVEAMKHVCNARDNSVVTRFKRQLGIGPSAYLKEHRLAVATKLLTTTRIRIWMIGELLGFSSVQLFIRNFRKRFKLTPEVYRRDHAQDGPEVDREEFSTIELRRALEGRLASDRSDVLIKRLLDQHPERSAQSEAASDRGDGADSNADQTGRLVPLEIWEEIRDLELADQVARIRERFGKARRELFELLSTKSRVEGRKDRQRGVQLAELALASLDSCAAANGDRFSSLRVLGWARLGNARRLALDFLNAEQAFEVAESEVRCIERSQRDIVEAEVFSLKAAYRTMQHRFDEAMKLATHAVTLLSGGQDSRLLAKTLLLRSSISGAQGQLEVSIADLTRANALVTRTDKRLKLSVWQNLAAAHAVAGQFEQAAKFLPAAKQLCREYLDPVIGYQLLLLEGRINKGLGQVGLAEERLVEAYEGFSGAGETGYAAVVGIELALLFCEEQRPGALELAARAVPVLDAFKIRSEALAARCLLAEEISRSRLTSQVLRKARSVLISLLQDPVVRSTTED